MQCVLDYPRSFNLEFSIALCSFVLERLTSIGTSNRFSLFGMRSCLLLVAKSEFTSCFGKSIDVFTYTSIKACGSSTATTTTMCDVQIPGCFFCYHRRRWILPTSSAAKGISNTCSKSSILAQPFYHLSKNIPHLPLSPPRYSTSQIHQSHRTGFFGVFPIPHSEPLQPAWCRFSQSFTGAKPQWTFQLRQK